MRTEKITMYNERVNDNVEKEYIIYTRDEMVNYIKNNEAEFKNYVLEVYAPCCYKISKLADMDKTDEFFIDEECKEIVLYEN